MEQTEMPYIQEQPREWEWKEFKPGPRWPMYNNSDKYNFFRHNLSWFFHPNVDFANPEDDSSHADPYPDFSQIAIVRRLFVFLFMLEFIVSATGNLMVGLTVYRTKAMHFPVNYYIVNLGICDFLVGVFVLPTKLFELAAENDLIKLTNVMCTVMSYLEAIVIFANVFTLVAICIERYYAVVYPVHSRIYLTRSRIGKVLTVVWIIPCLVASPILIYPSTAQTHHLYSEYGAFTRTNCADGFSDVFRFWYFIFLFCTMYLFPLIFIGATCFSIFRVLMKKIPFQPHRDPRAIVLEKGRRKVAKMVLVVAFVFFTCWSPYFMVTIVTQFQKENFFHTGHFFFTMLCINLLGFTHSCINPMIYCAMSTRFREGFKGILKSIWQYVNKSRFSSGTNSASLRRSQRACLNGFSNHQRQNSGSPSPYAPNESTGSTKPHPASQHPRSPKVQRSRTILLSFHTYPTPTCQAQLIPLTDCESSRNTYHPPSEFKDFCLAQESSIV